MDGARSAERSGTDGVRDLLFQLPSGQDLSREMQGVEDIRSRAQNGNPTELSPQELHRQLWQILTFRDNVSGG